MVDRFIATYLQQPDLASDHIRKTVGKTSPETHTQDSTVHMVRDVAQSGFHTAYPGTLSPYPDELQTTHVDTIYPATVNVQFFVFIRFKFFQNSCKRIQLFYHSGDTPVSR